MTKRHHKVIVIGAGISGVGLGVRLLEEGVDDFLIFERNDSVGGTWFEHTYPGCACDIPTHLYSYSFERNPKWSRLFPRQEEILDYVRTTARKRGVIPHIRFGCEMTHASWDETNGHWRIETMAGEFTCELLVSAIGATAEPDEPDIPGLEDFQGHRFHSARWDHDHDLAGERVAVIGTGPAAAQFVPRIQPEVGELVVFQRTPPWVLPHPDRPVPGAERLLYRLLPPAQDVQRNLIFGLLETIGLGFRTQNGLVAMVERLGRAHLRRQVADPELRAKLEPRYRFGCKRPILSNSYYPALTAANARVVTDAIAAVDGDAIVTEDGRRHEVDTIISAIGYRYSRSLLVDRITGADGRTLGEAWDRSPRAYLGSAVPGFPNMFILLGPNSIGINSVIFSVEAQINYVMSAIRTMDKRAAGRIEVRQEAHDSYIAWADAASEGTVWKDGGCRSYYLDDRGRQFAIYPGFASGYRRRTRKLDPDAYELGAPFSRP
ncbi:MAG: NAD(P)/FAD-dependent oxidoreductase [Actinomycetota bacterium]|nr:NAD(P)/FAD-dependent oxidoreductase [Actinomycetota bacterium]